MQNISTCNLGQVSSPSCKPVTKSDQPGEVDACKSIFVCFKCGLGLKYDYFGTTPPFVRHFVLQEDSYVLKDPFTDGKRCIILGSHCGACLKSVCVSQNCSLFYSKRFCIECVVSRMKEFPSEIKEELRKKTNQEVT